MNNLMQITTREKDCLRLYEGDIRIREKESEKLINRISDDKIWGDRGAYKILNALMFGGTENEEIRILKEGSKLNAYFIENIEETINILLDIYSSMCKYGMLITEPMRAYRIERSTSMQNLKEGYTSSCFSASKTAFQKEFADKNEIVLIELIIEAGVPYVDYEKILGVEYNMGQEKEILLPPFINIEVEEIKLSLWELRKLKIKDRNGKAPQKKYKIIAKKRNKLLPLSKHEKRNKNRIYQLIIDLETVNIAKQYILDMNNKVKIEEEKRQVYCNWKDNLHQYMKLSFREIEYTLNSNIICDRDK